MEKIKSFAGFLYRHSLVRYVITGGTTFMLDILLLVLLHGYLNVNLVIATSVAYWTAIAFNFFVNRQWTFGATDTHIVKHLTAYLTLLGANYLFTVAFVGIASALGMHYTIAKVLAVILQTSWTYLAYKKIIFR